MSVTPRRRYALVGLGSRARLYTGALLGRYREHGELVALCDVNETRMRWHNRRIESELGGSLLPSFRPEEFPRMLVEMRVDTVIVTSVDATHHRYIIEALRGGCDVITEKPLTIDATRCQAIVDAVGETGRSVRIAFNYRYANRNTEVRRLLAEGAVGDVLSVHFEWLLDTWHGADYFRRWHRDKGSSGGLMVHKASHHFDLVNWWLQARPETVFGFGRLGFYGRENAEARGETLIYGRAHGSAAAGADPFAIHLEDDPVLKGLYLDAEADDGYLRDQGVFSAGIGIEDDMAVVTRYSTGATLTYHLSAYAPWEGYRVGINGSEGRLELEAIERSHVDGTPPVAAGAIERISVQRHWARREEIAFEVEDGGHAGADSRLLAELFGEQPSEDPLQRASSHLDGVFAILPGIGANLSFASGQAVDLTQLVRL